MKLLFSTFDLHRKDEYVAITSIYEEGRKPFVVKTPLFEAGKPHLQRFANAYPLLSKAFGKGAVAEAKEQGGQLRIEFVTGKSLSVLLREAYAAKDIDGIENILTRYRDFLMKAEDQSASAERFATYQIPGPILAPADIDLIFDNIIEKEDGNLCIIDYEWSELEGIPFQLIAYRAVAQFANREGGISLYPKEKLLAFFGISKKTAKACERASSDFVASVLKEEEAKQPEAHYLFSAIADYEKGRQELFGQIKAAQDEAEAAKQETAVAKLELADTKNDLKVTKERLGEANERIAAREGELGQIKNSRGYRWLLRWYKFRDWMLPKGSKRRLFVKASLYAFRHPIITWRAILRGKAKDFFRAAKSNPETAFHKVENYHQKMEDKGDLTNLVLYKEKEFTPFTFPKCDKPLVSIIIPVYNQFFYTYNCLKAVLENTDMEKTPYEVIIGDDVSSDETKDIQKMIGGLIVARNEKNTGFLLNCNQAAAKAKGKYVYFLNNDTNVQKGYMDALIGYIESHQDVGAVGSKLVYGNGQLQEAGGILWKDGSAWNYGNCQNREEPPFNYVKDVDYISGASLLVRKDLFDQLGGFDKRYVPAYCEDSDLCFAIRYQLGYRVVYIPTSVVVHFEGISNGKDVSSGLKQYQVVNNGKFVKKWKKELERHYPNGENVFHARDLTGNKKTILVVDHYVPQFDKDAGSRTVFGYLKLMVQLGYNVKFIGDNFFRSEPYTRVLQEMGIEVLYGNKMFMNWKSWLKENEPYIDYVLLNRPHISIKYIDFMKENMHAKILYYGHDLHMLRLEREKELTGNENLQADIDRFRKIEETLFEKADYSYYPSQVEVDYLKTRYPGKNFGLLQSFMFENGPFVDHKKRKDLMFVGGFGHTPNVDAVLMFAREVFPLVKEAIPDIKWHVVGSNATDEVKALNCSSIIVHGFVSDEELAKLYNETALVVAPLRYGAGIKGKIVEAMDHCVPVVTTTCGAEGIDEADKALAIEDDPKKMAELIVSIYQDPKKRLSMAQEGKRIINEHYSYESAGKILEKELGR